MQQQRAPRFSFSYPLQFTAEGVTVRGYCLNLSASGLLAIFDVPLELWTTGEVRIEDGEDGCTVQSRVARAGALEAGLAFVPASAVERQAVERLLQRAARHSQLVGAVPF